MNASEQSDRLLDAERIDQEFASDVLKGLSASHKSLPCRWFYDARGSDLFEQITRLSEYYPTRSEIEILERRAAEIAEIGPADGVMVEFGSGSSRKTEILLSALPDLAAYAPIDVSAPALEDAERRLAARFPKLRVLPVTGDFSGELNLPSALPQARRLGFFPGSTIGNFQPAAARDLLEAFSRLLGDGANLIVGVDLRKSLDILLPAYDDREGVTAEFNRNLLRRINVELGGDFDLEQFAHEAVWNEKDSRVEMHLVSRREQSVGVLGRVFRFAASERIHTENSYKHTIDGFRDLARRAGWQPTHVWTDEARRFSVHCLSAKPGAP
jgi:L-histidine N-alpha-methyltransferase